MKTLAELNSKWWWRLVKVIYLILMVLLSIFGLFLIYTTFQDNPYKEDANYTSLINNDPKLEEILNQISFENLTPDQEKKLEEVKPKLREELKKISANFSDLKKDFSKSDIEKIVDLYNRFDLQIPGYQEYLRDEAERTRNYELYEKTRFTKIGGLSILFLIFVYIGTILFRGSIYYIILGKFNPEK